MTLPASTIPIILRIAAAAKLPSARLDTVLPDANLAYKAIAVRLDHGEGGVARGRRFLALVRCRKVPDIINRMVVADVLERIGDRRDEVLLLDGGHAGLLGGEHPGVPTTVQGR